MSQLLVPRQQLAVTETERKTRGKQTTKTATPRARAVRTTEG
jgi:hypothetical protein